MKIKERETEDPEARRGGRQISRVYSSTSNPCRKQNAYFCNFVYISVLYCKQNSDFCNFVYSRALSCKQNLYFCNFVYISVLYCKQNSDFSNFVYSNLTYCNQKLKLLKMVYSNGVRLSKQTQNLVKNTDALTYSGK